MRLEPLYRLTFRYTEEWEVSMGEGPSPAGVFFFIAEGHCSGTVVGRLRAANHPLRRGRWDVPPRSAGDHRHRRRGDDHPGHARYGRAYPVGARQVVVTVTHVSDHPRYARMNDCLSVGCGEVRRLSEDETELVIDVSELIWEPMEAETRTSTHAGQPTV